MIGYYRPHTLNTPFVWQEENNNHDCENEIYGVVVEIESSGVTESNEEETSFDHKSDPYEET